MAASWDDRYEGIGGRLEELRGQAHEAYARSPRPGKRDRPARPAPDATDLDKSIAQAIELRGLISDAHAAVKDLRNVIREYRELISRAPDMLVTAIEEAVAAEFKATNRVLQAEVDRKSEELTASVTAVRKEILSQLMLAELHPIDNARYLQFRWKDATAITLACMEPEEGKI